MLHDLAVDRCSAPAAIVQMKCPLRHLCGFKSTTNVSGRRQQLKLNEDNCAQQLCDSTFSRVKTLYSTGPSRAIAPNYVSLILEHTTLKHSTPDDAKSTPKSDSSFRYRYEIFRRDSKPLIFLMAPLVLSVPVYTYIHIYTYAYTV